MNKAVWLILLVLVIAQLACSGGVDGVVNDINDYSNNNPGMDEGEAFDFVFGQPSKKTGIEIGDVYDAYDWLSELGQ